MFFSNQFVKRFSWFSIIISVLHFIGEGYFMYLFGQPHLQTLADLIAVLLLFFGGFTALKNNKSLGLLCGAWGFSFCLNYRAWVWRYYAKIEGESNLNVDIVGNILLFLLIVTFIAFIISISLNLPKTTIK